MQRVSKPDFFKDSTIKAELVGEIQATSALIFEGIKALESEVTGAFIKHSQIMFDSHMFNIIPVKMPDFGLVKFDKSDFVDKIDIQKKMEIQEVKDLTVVVSEFLGNKAHETQETVTEYLHNNEFKNFGGQIINLNGGVENEARASIANARNGANFNLGNLKKSMSNIKGNLEGQKKLVEDQSVWVGDVKERILRLLGTQEKLAVMVEEMANKI